jgi:mannose-6-phosphate isomerase-like protein (cupin superfamily)
LTPVKWFLGEVSVNERAAPYVLAAGQARSHPGSVPTIKTGAADTGGLLAVADGVLGPRTSGPPLHIHYETDECFYVTEGHLLVQVGQERHDLGPGYFAWLPRQTPHTYANVSDSPVHVVGVYVPGGIEEFFAAQGAYFARLEGPPDPEQLAAIWAEHPGRTVGPPIMVDAAPAASRT